MQHGQAIGATYTLTAAGQISVAGASEPITTFALYRNGLRQRWALDFTYANTHSGVTYGVLITPVVPLASDDVIVIDYYY